MNYMTLLFVVLATVGPQAPPRVVSQATINSSQVYFVQTPIGNAIELLSAFDHRSVAFDMAFDGRRLIDFEAKGVTRNEALRLLVERERLLVVEVAGVYVVSDDTSAMRDNLSPARVVACGVANEDERRRDVVFHRAMIATMLGELSKSASRSAELDAALINDVRPYNLTLRAVTAAEAIQVLCLTGHIDVREEGETLVFSGAASRTR